MIRNLFFWQNLYFNSHINSNNRILIQTNSDHVKAYGSRIVKFICLNLHFRLFQKSFMEGFLKVNWRCSNTTYRQARFVLHFFFDFLLEISSLGYLPSSISLALFCLISEQRSSSSRLSSSMFEKSDSVLDHSSLIFSIFLISSARFLASIASLLSKIDLAEMLDLAFSTCSSALSMSEFVFFRFVSTQKL